MTLSVHAVTVHTDGAFVTRRGTLPVRRGVAAVRCLPLLIDESSLQVRLQGAKLRGVRLTLDVEGIDRADESEARVALLEAEHQHRLLTLELELLGQQRQRLAQIEPEKPDALEGDGQIPDAQRLHSWAQLEHALEPWARTIDERCAELTTQIEAASQAVEIARSQYEGVSSAQVWSRWQPARVALLDVHDDGSGPSQLEVEFSYRVDGAFWTPAYALHLTQGARRGRLTVRALVAQVTGEDWPQATLTLSATSSRRSIDVAKLPALKLGVSQPEPAPAWRELPEDFEDLFPDTMIEAAAGTAWPGAEEEFEAAQREHDSKPRATHESRAESHSRESSEELESDVVFGGLGRVVAGPESAAASNAPLIRAGAMSGPFARRSRRGSASAPPPPPPPPPAPVRSVEPRKDALAYANLRLADYNADPGVRGRLQPRSLAIEAAELAVPSDCAARADEAMGALHSGVHRLRRRTLPTHHVLPGPIDGIAHRYECSGRAPIASDGRFHGVAVETRELELQTRLWSVPREDPRVFRQAWVSQGQGAPLLPGPADIIVDGALLRTVPFAGGGRRQKLGFDLGVEDALKLARNVRYREESAGFLKGRRVLHTEIEVEMASTLAQDAEVELHERLPIAGQSDIEVEVIAARPEAETYPGEIGHATLKGGRRQRVRVPAGACVTCKFHYAIYMPNDQQLDGGDRRG